MLRGLLRKGLGLRVFVFGASTTIQFNAPTKNTLNVLQAVVLILSTMPELAYETTRL